VSSSDTSGPLIEPVETLDPFTSRRGAVGSPPLHYGNPLGEQRELAAGRAIVDLSDRDILSVSGPDRLSWLDSLTSQRLVGLAPGVSAETLLLDPSGRVEYAARVLDDGDTTWLLMDAGTGAGFLAFLTKMRFMLRVEVRDRGEEFATIGTLGELSEHPRLSAVVAAPNGVLLAWVDPWRAIVAGGFQYAAIPVHPGESWNCAEVLVERARLSDLDAVPAAGTLALEALRIEAWRPRAATELDATTIPHELDWIRSAVHLSKGCYRGQETVAKVHNLGHPPRRLVMLHLDGSEGVLPVAGDGASRRQRRRSRDRSVAAPRARADRARRREALGRPGGRAHRAEQRWPAPGRRAAGHRADRRRGRGRHPAASPARGRPPLVGTPCPTARPPISSAASRGGSGVSST
jgi:folate-binding protein YgfZ